MAFLSIQATNISRIRRKLEAVAEVVPDILNDRDGQMGKALIESTRERFLTKRGPNGRKWRPLVQGNFPRSNSNKADILVDTGALADSIGVVTLSGDTDLKRNTGGGFRVGVLGNHPGALTQQYGGRSPFHGGRVVPRPFIGISDKDVKMIEKIADRKLRAALRKK